MKIGLIDADSHNFPNLCLMKLSAWHKMMGDDVEWWDGFAEYDRVYISRVFDSTYSAEPYEPVNTKEIVKGGTGYDLKNTLPDEIEHIMPDYSIYHDIISETKNAAYGFLTRGCPRHCEFCIVGDKEGLRSHKVADLSEFWNGQKEIELLDPNLLAAKEHIELLGQLADSKARVNINQGMDARLLTEENIVALNNVNIKMLHFAWDYMKYEKQVLRGLELYAKIGGVKNYKNRRVYVLTNFDTTMEENLYRVRKLLEIGYDPYVMVYDRTHAPKEIKKFQRWVNKKFVFRSCTWEEYDTSVHTPRAKKEK